METGVIDFTPRIDKLLDEKSKSKDLKKWRQQWDLLMKEFLGNEESETKGKGKERKKKRKKRKDVGNIPENME